MHKKKGPKWIRIIKKQECKRSRDTDTFNKVKKTQELFFNFFTTQKSFYLVKIHGIVFI